MTENRFPPPKSLASSRSFKNYLSKCFPHDTITHTSGYHYCSGFIRRGKKVVYYNSGDFRCSGRGLMIRSARDEHDFSGDSNIWPTVDKLASTIDRLLS
jgi:hypothetical protein